MPRTTPAKRPARDSAAPVATSNTTDSLRLYSVGQAADSLGLGRTKTLALIRSGRLQCRRLDGRIRIAYSDLKAFADALPVGYVKGTCNAHDDGDGHEATP